MALSGNLAATLLSLCLVPHIMIWYDRVEYVEQLCKSTMVRALFEESKDDFTF